MRGCYVGEMKSEGGGMGKGESKGEGGGMRDDG